MIRWGKVVGPSQDKGPYKLVEIECDGKKQVAQVLDMGGLHTTPIVDGQAMVFLVDGDEGKWAAICMPPPADRVDAQKEGDMRLKNHKAGSIVEMDEGGNIVLRSASGGIVDINPA
jgi:hypothetical protein